MADKHTLAEQKVYTMMHTYIYIQPLTNIPTKYQLSTPYGFQNRAQTRFYSVKITSDMSKVKSRSHHDIVHLHPLTNLKNFVAVW